MNDVMQDQYQETRKTPPQLDHNKYTLDKTGAIRGDYLFSYWIFLWFFVYYFLGTKIVSTNKHIASIFKFITDNMNPLFGLWLALIENIITFIFIVRSKFDWWFIGIYIFMILSIKILPLYLLRNTKIRLIPNIISLIVIFVIYNIYLYANSTNAYEIYDKTIQSLKDGNNQTPLFRTMHQLFRLFQ